MFTQEIPSESLCLLDLSKIFTEKKNSNFTEANLRSIRHALHSRHKFSMFSPESVKRFGDLVGGEVDAEDHELDGDDGLQRNHDAVE